MPGRASVEREGHYIELFCLRSRNFCYRYSHHERSYRNPNHAPDFEALKQ